MTRSNIIIIELLTLFAFSAFALAQEIHCAARQGDQDEDFLIYTVTKEMRNDKFFESTHERN